MVTALRLVAHELGEVPVDRPEPPAQKVFGVKSQIVHVFMNLVINSAHALKAGDLGRPPRIAIMWEIADERLKVAVRDNGTGVAPANLPRLFEPFFTTKDVGQGTGLGLSICHTIVKNHGGAISVASQEGQWTQVSFDLPLATAGSFA
jgi:two-component system sensor histidine kinase PhcS